MNRFLSGLVIVCFANSSVFACCMLPTTYDGTISQSDHEAVIVHHGGREELVLRINYKIVGDTMPDYFAWVITVPNEPDNYSIADTQLFEDMFKLSKKLSPQYRDRHKSGGGGSFDDRNVELGKHVKVGPYDIQPVRGVGPNALKGLNTWLKANGFPAEAPAHMKYFVENQFTFLCIKITASHEEKAIGPSGMIPPLHLSLASPKPYFPLRFSSRQGVFDVNLHLFTPQKFSYSASHRVLQQINWTNTHDTRNYRLSIRRMPDSLKSVFTKSKIKTGQKVWFYNYIRGQQVNRDNSIARWTNDLFFNGVPHKYGAANKPPTVRLGRAR